MDIILKSSAETSEGLFLFPSALPCPGRLLPEDAALAIVEKWGPFRLAKQLGIGDEAAIAACEDGMIICFLERITRGGYPTVVPQRIFGQPSNDTLRFRSVAEIARVTKNPAESLAGIVRRSGATLGLWRPKGRSPRPAIFVPDIRAAMIWAVLLAGEKTIGPGVCQANDCGRLFTRGRVDATFCSPECGARGAMRLSRARKRAAATPPRADSERRPAPILAKPKE